MNPSEIQAHADHKLTTLRTKARDVRAAPLAAPARKALAAALRSWAQRLDGRPSRPRAFQATA